MKKKYNCPIEVTLDAIGGKWKTLILWHLKEKSLRSGQIKKLVPGITQKILTQKLRELENHGLISRKVYAQMPPKVEYTLTTYGKTIRPILDNLCKWGTKHIKNLPGSITFT
ncbi:MAG: helix-turn-helix transcriptional regulator [Candidatus Firestonebacteria bacterium]|nr:helix-turn-helix transcriptional regulator [Candidatus Firestonebacteria bacterium]